MTPAGTVLCAETDLGQLRLGRRDEAMRLDNHLLLVSGNKADAALELTVIEPALPPAPPSVELTVNRSGGSVIIDWPAGVRGMLQQSETLTPGGWTNVPNGATPPVTLPATRTTMFYQLVIAP